MERWQRDCLSRDDPLLTRRILRVGTIYRIGPGHAQVVPLQEPNGGWLVFDHRFRVCRDDGFDLLHIRRDASSLQVSSCRYVINASPVGY